MATGLLENLWKEKNEKEGRAKDLLAAEGLSLGSGCFRDFRV